MQSGSLDIEPALAAAVPPHTVWRTPQGLPCFSSPTPGRLLWLRARRVLARWRRSWR